MKTLFRTALLLVCGFPLFACTPHAASDAPYRIEEGTIVFAEPARAEGQCDVLQLRCDPIPVVRVAFIGLGMRGSTAVERFTQLDGVEIVALCDKVPAHVERAQRTLSVHGLPAAQEFTGADDWRRVCELEGVDLIYNCTDWQMHVPIALYAMERGKHVAVEVPAALTVADCWALVDAAERTRRHCMMLENCVYDFFELTTLNMAQHGLFGEILHTEGSYIHNLEPYWDYYQGNWRLDFNQSHRGDVYATHGLGPACQLLDIHRGDKMNYLVAMDTKSVNGLKLAKEKMGAETFANADQTPTLIKTERGRTILLEHNVYTPRPYSRMYQLTGTEGFANKYPVEGYAFRPEQIAGEEIPDHENLSEHSFIPQAAKAALMERYKHPIARDIEEKARRVGGHGGMDFIMDYRLVYCLRHGLPLDQDVYDAAEWSCIGSLTSASLEHNSMPVAVPDFTRGDWDKVDGFRHAMAQ